ncbi:MAG: glycosyltransferase family 2 protein, partial [Candidatus Lokiarchaeota archaeon]|nr:glycosyltransferase family 2 protein [Candidatus Lokiarchaeota archaeon]
MSTNPLVSVLMPVYNGDRYLNEAIESILSQTYENFEFIVINDGSTDHSKEILSSFAQIDNRIQVFHQENHGLIFSLNKGLELSR